MKKYLFLCVGILFWGALGCSSTPNPNNPQKDVKPPVKKTATLAEDQEKIKNLLPGLKEKGEESKRAQEEIRKILKRHPGTLEILLEDFQQSKNRQQRLIYMDLFLWRASDSPEAGRVIFMGLEDRDSWVKKMAEEILSRGDESALSLPW